MRNRSAVAALLLISFTALATSSSSLTVQCPVCGHSVESVAIHSSNNGGGQDRDLFNRASGDQVFMVAATTCAVCGYSGFPGDFDDSPRADAGVRVAPSLRAAILDGGLKIPKAETPLPAWARLDLIAQRLVLEHAPAEAIAHSYLEAAWAVRVSDASIEASCEYPSPMPPGLDENRALREIGIANWFVAQSARVEGAERTNALLCGAFLLRRHGEHAAVQSLSAQLNSSMGADPWSVVEQKLNASIAREREYQRLVIQYFDVALAKAPKNDKNRVFWLYLKGETLRRLGDRKTADTVLSQVKSSADVPDWLKKYAVEQLALLRATK